MIPTIKLYDEHPYDTAFTATILSAVPGKTPATAEIILNQTLFFPEEGGQTPDRGSLAGFPVVDVQIRNDVITHILDFSAAADRASADANKVDGPAVSGNAGAAGAACAADQREEKNPTSGIPEVFAEGAEVSGTLDWEHRYSNMQNHSGEHVLSGILHTLYGYENVGFRLSDNTVTLDTSGQLTDAQILDLERRANEVVWRNVPITCEYPAPEVVAALEYRSKKAIDGAIRIVTIEGVDACACCAPHVRRTGEIGLIKILEVLHTRNDMRLTIVCGSRALAEMQSYQQALTELSHITKVPRVETPAAAQRLLDEIGSLKESVKNAQIRYVDMRLAVIAESERMAAGTDTPDLSAKGIWIFEDTLDNLAQRNFMNQLCNRGYRFAGVFAGSDTDGWRYLIGSRGDDARVPNNILRERFQARGGGKPEMVQGSLAATQEQIRAALEGC